MRCSAALRPPREFLRGADVLPSVLDELADLRRCRLVDVPASPVLGHPVPVCRGRRVSVTKGLPGTGQRHAGGEHPRCQRVPQHTRAEPRDTRPVARVPHQHADPVGAQRLPRRVRGQEDRPAPRRPRPASPQILCQCRPSFVQHREFAFPVDRDLTAVPADVIKGQCGHLTGAKTEPRQQHEHRVIAALGGHAGDQRRYRQLRQALLQRWPASLRNPAATRR